MSNFRRIYEEIAEALLRTAFTPTNSRAIFRKAGIRAGGPGLGSVGLLIAGNGGAVQPQTAGTTRIRYDALLANGGDFDFTPGDDEFVCVAGGICRVNASVAVGTPGGDGLFGHGIETSGGQFAALERVLYTWPTTSPQPARLVITGATPLYVEPGEILRHVFYDTHAKAGPILQAEEAHRLYAEMMP